ncbi:hypothetical protein M758_UG077700 [Ceratodon purpureus]|nr:hypothetical protein M758_UG077700 [Ceratodon purpureus]
MQNQPLKAAMKALLTTLSPLAARLTGECGSGSGHTPVNAKNSPPRTRPLGRLTFTPLQKWEYENGYPVDGVPDTREWAIDVGLEVGSNDPDAQRKRRKLASAEAPPKYIASGGLNVLSSDDEDNPGSPSENPEEDGAEKSVVSRKGKEKVE